MATRRLRAFPARAWAVGSARLIRRLRVPLRARLPDLWQAPHHAVTVQRWPGSGPAASGPRQFYRDDLLALRRQRQLALTQPQRIGPEQLSPPAFQAWQIALARRDGVQL